MDDVETGKPIRIIITGDTIDKEYNAVTGELTFTKSHLTNMLNQVRCRVEVILEEIMLKDSLQMRREDREKMLKRCSGCAETKIIITHGTDTMVDTASLLGRNLKGRTVVLVGALIPYAFGASDALFNLGCAVSAVQILPAGVYITMNGKMFSWDHVRKNKSSGDFEEI